jgi:hypothetical protein
MMEVCDASRRNHNAVPFAQPVSLLFCPHARIDVIHCCVLIHIWQPPATTTLRMGTVRSPASWRGHCQAVC